jgi:predicted MFS family arabinose efflux permease
MRPETRPRVHYAWVVFAVAGITLLGAAGFRSAPSVLVDPLRDDLGWSRATVGFAVSVNLILFGLAGPFAAALMQRFGLRRVVVSALLAISTGAVLTTQMSEPWHLVLLWGVLVGAGSGCLASVFAATVATRWFVARRGLVTGALTAASATGQLVFLPVLAALAERHGWPWVGLVIAIGATATIPLVVLFLRNSPADVGLLAYGATGDEPVPSPQAHPVRAAFEGLRLAWVSGAFWLLFGSFFVCGLSTNGLIGTHFISAAGDHGITETRAAGLLALIGVFDVIGTLASGWLTDRYDPRVLLGSYYGLRGLSLLVLQPAFDADHAGLWGFMMFYGLDWVATVPPTVALCTRVFGVDRGPVVFGWVFAGHQLGAAIAAYGAGVIRGATGSYQLAFVIAGGACLIAAAASLRIGGGRGRARELSPVLTG